jgi:hypothetical protein
MGGVVDRSSAVSRQGAGKVGLLYEIDLKNLRNGIVEEISRACSNYSSARWKEANVLGWENTSGIVGGRSLVAKLEIIKEHPSSPGSIETSSQLASAALVIPPRCQAGRSASRCYIG